MRVAVCAILGEFEKPYLNEWIQWYKLINVDEIFLYINNWKYQSDDKKIHIIQFDGFGRQKEAYKDFLQNYSNAFDWGIFCDGDEFLYPQGLYNMDVKCFLDHFSGAFALQIPWRLFGDSMLTYDPNDLSVLNRFVYRQDGYDHTTKCCLNLKDFRRLGAIDKINWNTPHNTNACMGMQYAVDTQVFIGPFHDFDRQIEFPFFAHYATKTRDEWLKRISYPKADHPINSPTRYKNDIFDLLNRNDVKDTRLRDFFNQNCKQFI